MNFKKPRIKFAPYIWIIGFGIVSSIAYYVNFNEYIRESWYLIISVFVASHGMLAAGIVHLTRRVKRSRS